MSKPAKSAHVGLLHLGDQLLLADRPSCRARIMIAVPCVSSAQMINARLPAQLLEPDPDVGLEVLDQVAEVDVAVGVGQGAGDQDPTSHNSPSLWPFPRGVPCGAR